MKNGFSMEEALSMSMHESEAYLELIVPKQAPAETGGKQRFVSKRKPKTQDAK